MAANLNGFWIYRDHVKEGMKWLEAGLAKSPTTGTLVRANALRAAGKLADLLGDYSLEEALAKESLTLYRELGNSPGIARALERLAESAFQLGNFQAAAGSFQEALEIWRALGDDFQLAQVLNGMGMVSVALRHYDLAERYLTESLDIAQRLGHTIIVAYVTSSLAFIALWRENYGQVRALLLRSLAMTETIGQKSFYAQVLMGFAGLEALPPEGGNPERAARILAAADALFVGADISLDFLERRDFDELLAAARAQLPDTEWWQAWNEGCTFSVEQAIVYALANSSETVP
jgi:tetratricopeptide (TPR) repeat protein